MLPWACSPAYPHVRICVLSQVVADSVKGGHEPLRRKTTRVRAHALTRAHIRCLCPGVKIWTHSEIHSHAAHIHPLSMPRCRRYV